MVKTDEFCRSTSNLKTRFVSIRNLVNAVSRFRYQCTPEIEQLIRWRNTRYDYQKRFLQIEKENLKISVHRGSELGPKWPLERRPHKSANWCSYALTWLAVVGPCLRAFSVWFEFSFGHSLWIGTWCPLAKKIGPSDHKVRKKTSSNPGQFSNRRRDATLVTAERRLHNNFTFTQLQFTYI